MIGITLIIGTYFLISENHAWPGYLAAIPVLGTWLVIQSNVEKSYITSNVYFQKLGLWSYSIYLWHWPIAVAFSYYVINEYYKIIGIIISIILGYLSFTFIEQRKSISINPKKSIAVYSLIMLSFAVGGSSLFQAQGMPISKDLTSNSLIQGGTADDYKLHYGLSLLNTDKEYDYLLIGDSHSNHYTRGILKEGSRVKSSWYPICMSFPNSMSKREGIVNSLKDGSWKEDCKKNHKLGLDNNKKIIIAQSWERPIEKSLECTSKDCNLTDNYYYDLQVQLKELIELYGKEKRIYIIGQLPIPEEKEITRCLKTRKLLGLNVDCQSTKAYPKATKKINKVLSSVASGYTNVIFINPGDAICNNHNCKYGINENAIFLEDNHLSGYGSEIIWKHIVNKIETI